MGLFGRKPKRADDRRVQANRETRNGAFRETLAPQYDYFPTRGQSAPDALSAAQGRHEERLWGRP